MTRDITFECYNKHILGHVNQVLPLEKLLLSTVIQSLEKQAESNDWLIMVTCVDRELASRPSEHHVLTVANYDELEQWSDDLARRINQSCADLRRLRL